MKKLLLLACVSMIALSACNTIKGAGEDISRGGRAVSNTATKVQQNVTAQKFFCVRVI